MTTSNDMPLAAKPVDRAAHRRTDSDWLTAASRKEDVLIFLMQRGQPLVEDAGLVWLGAQANSLSNDATRLFIGQDKAGAAIFALDMPDNWSLAGSPIAGLGEFQDMRAAIGLMSPMEANCASTARSLFEWHHNHGFCAKCGHASALAEAGWKRICPSCNAEHFPRTDPVAIMLAVKDDKCLLGRGPGWPAGFMSCLAGFVEAGETIEQAAARELFEEAGVRANPESTEYLFCQPWPFPSSLMMGVIIEAETENITIDPKEIQDARWFTRTEARAILAGEHDEIYCPPPFAVAHHILKAWAERDA